ncbi:hypothetical protein V1498_20420 [Peribacillus sp. SCS-26]|uniref:hypothetical protein n=1 Tax=Paraperibacillus marinus TaxID=3115295 RepID=UPI0039059474
MSMITYVGFNFPIKPSEDVVENEFEVYYVCPDEEHRGIVKQKHFTTPYIYEILQANPIWELTDYNKAHSPHNYEKSRKTFLHICHSLKELLPKGDICEIYICWDGEEKEEREVELKVNLNDLQMETIEIYEKCFILVEN